MSATRRWYSSRRPVRPKTELCPTSYSTAYQKARRPRIACILIYDRKMRMPRLLGLKALARAALT
jgi:hypothetical protein